MPDFTTITIRPHLARVLLHAPNHAMIPAQAKAQLQNELTFSPTDLVIDATGEPRWWHAALTAVNSAGGLRIRGLVHPHNPAEGNVWRLTDPNGVAWAEEVQAMLQGVATLPKVAYQPDARIRKAVEVRALEVTEAQYRLEGYEPHRVGRPYDLDCVRALPPYRRHVEVKGFQDENPLTVILTAGEVKHARESPVPVDFVIVVGISIAGDAGQITANGGSIFRHVRNWNPLDAHLAPTHFSYAFP